MPALSIVMPFYNVRPYLARALESLRMQRHTDFEAILVDDGSTDGSSTIAAGFADRDPRFHVVRQENTGPGPARNRGIAEARGTYLAFADGDDEVPPEAYASMIRSLETTGSDIACGRVLRFVGEEPPFLSELHEEIGRTAAGRTHITRYPALVANRTMWNQMYRRAFWDDHRFGFDAVLYEDIAVSAEAHARASSVDVLADIVYRWRMRTAQETTSITGAFGHPDNVLALMNAVARTNAVFLELAAAAKPAHDKLMIRYDFEAVLVALPQAGPETRKMILSRVEECVATFPAGIADDLPAELQDRYAQIRALLADA
ncbi:glycosyltransferase family 2 protein [Micromonospora sp. NPDC048999]|uniref:glycosyltransferase family 2 protein n=1 Tax=Micromonospora sp. NPDC048999 TaxID=3155391 RepID=UPI0033F4FA2F